MTDAHDAMPLRIAEYTPMLAAWQDPKSSHEMMTSFWLAS
jgi:hypothetical protein